MSDPVKRCAIVGTAPSWKQTPWDDPTLEIWSLNDAYMHQLPRADRWFEQHPLDRLWFRRRDQKVVFEHEVPPGHYVRPEGHIDWLKAQSQRIPVYLKDAPTGPGWGPQARRFPIEEADARFGTYWASGPSYMVALAIMEGYREIHIYGIHLATQQEYVDQRPNFEHLLGIARGMGIVVHMAKDSPVMRHGWRYGYEPRPHKPASPLLKELEDVKRRKSALVKSLLHTPFWRRRRDGLDALRRVEAHELEIKQRLATTA